MRVLTLNHRRPGGQAIRAAIVGMAVRKARIIQD
jgi:hypothetical protein